VSNVLTSYETVFLGSMNKDGETAAEDEAVAEQNDEVVFEATEEE